jgi:hypothetical protein
VNVETLKDLWAFLKVRKRWWLLPILLALGMVGLLAVAGSNAAVSPFIYTLF